MTAFDRISTRPLKWASRSGDIDRSSNNGIKALDSYRALQSQKALTDITRSAPVATLYRGKSPHPLDEKTEPQAG